MLKSITVPQKCFFSWEWGAGSDHPFTRGSLAPRLPVPNERHLARFIRFCAVHAREQLSQTDRQTDRQTHATHVTTAAFYATNSDAASQSEP